MDTVQIGSLVVSKVAWDVLAPLLGVLIGGLITFITTYLVDKQRWRQKKEIAFREQQRESLLNLLEFLTNTVDGLKKRTSMGEKWIRDKLEGNDTTGRHSEWIDWSSGYYKIVPIKYRVLLDRKTDRRMLDIVMSMIRIGDGIEAGTGGNLESLKIAGDQLSDLRQYVEKEYINTFK